MKLSLKPDQNDQVFLLTKKKLNKMGALEERIKQDNEILKKIKREIIKCAKKGEFHYYWEITGLNKSTVDSIIKELETEGKNVNNKGMNFKIIRW